MKKIIAGACAAIMAVTSFGAAAAPASAGQLQITTGAQFINVQSWGTPKGGWERDRGWNARDRFERRRDGWYFNGHRGSRDRHRGYQRYNGFWFPPEAFAGAIIGGIIGGVITNQAPRHGNSYGAVRITREHLVWCENRFRSYRASDNTFQPYNGPRQQCISPYLR
ncbi:BA14K family protein [Devosia sp. RR2S18]|uniref:BA14K family protein n=1 Tax=Devosia rhizosphaerae TaxID=3049774 RepID=UPI002541C05E|nr:BA14K family protein [Devosia sp. RR2S18]WIJ23978.1 BA14K family protein [Devosia sp. RR2S18]